MTVSVIGPRLVRVEPDVLDADDVLELGAALVEEHGHLKRDSGDEANGFSIHGAIGEAAKRATGEKGKDSPRSRELRDAAAEKLRAKHAPQEQDINAAEFALNDQAPGAAEVVDLMLSARGAA